MTKQATPLPTKPIEDKPMTYKLFKGDKMKPLFTVELRKKINSLIESRATKEAIIREITIIYPSLVSVAEHGLKEINTPIGTWKFEATYEL